jgi:hypothetical protein
MLCSKWKKAEVKKNEDFFENNFKEMELLEISLTSQKSFLLL